MKVKNHLDTLEYNEPLQPWMKNSLKRKSRICKFTLLKLENYTKLSLIPKQ